MATAKPTSQPEGFTGFGPRALDFFKALAFHQDKAWFDENRALYEDEVRAPLEALVLALSARFETAGLPLRGDRRSIFRLNRDIRFAKDKRPYKTNAGAVITPDGTKKAQGLVYIHIDPEGCFAAAGFWHPEPHDLLALRRAIAADEAGFRACLARLAKAGLSLGEGDALSRLPKGFEGITDPAIADAVKCRNLIVRRPLAAKALQKLSLIDEIAAFAKAAEPLLRFGWTALGKAV